MLQVYVLCGGYLELDVALMLPDHDPGTRWTVPVPTFLVVHAGGRLLFDTGVHCASTPWRRVHAPHNDNGAVAFPVIPDVNRRALIDLGQVAFLHNVKNGPQGVFLATPAAPDITKIKVKPKGGKLELRVDGNAMITDHR